MEEAIAMTPKEKAEELISKYVTNQNVWYLENLVDGLRLKQAKYCALIAVDEILEETMERDGMRVINNPYWLEVKQEIEKL